NVPAHHLCLPRCLHDALPISATYTVEVKMDSMAGPIEFKREMNLSLEEVPEAEEEGEKGWFIQWDPGFINKPFSPSSSASGTSSDRKSTRLNSSHVSISYAVF